MAATGVVTGTGALLLNDQFNPYLQKMQPQKFDPNKHFDDSFASSLVRPTDWAYDDRGGLRIAEISDGQALNGSLYYSTTQKTLTYKNTAGKLFQLMLKEVLPG